MAPVWVNRKRYRRNGDAPTGVVKGREYGEDLPSDVALRAADDLAVGLAFCAAAPGVLLSARVVAQAIPPQVRFNIHLRTDGHHIIHWSDGGPTELENLVSLCRPHHRTVHEQGWRIHIADGLAVVQPPP